MQDRVIRSEADYEEAVKRLMDAKARHNLHAAELTRTGLNPDEIKRAMDPLRSFSLQLEEEVEAYERLKRGHVGEP